MKLILTSIILLAACAGSAMASAIQFATGGGRGHMFVTNDAARVVATSLVRVGYLTTPGSLSSFVEFAATTISNPGSTPATQIGGFLTIPAASPTVAAAAKGAQVYLWVYNAASSGVATQAGIFTSADPSWVIPASFTGDVTETSNLSLNLAAGVTAIADPDAKFSGPNTSAPTFTRGNILIAGTAAVGSIYTLGGPAIPEPSSVGLFALLGMAALRRRR